MPKGERMTEPAGQEHQAVFSKRASYGITAATVVGTTALAVTAPQTFAAGLGSVGMSSAVFVTPVWRFIKSVNDMYTDISMYVAADWERLRGHHFGPPSHERRDALAKHKPTYSRPKAYAVLGATSLASGFLALNAPSVLFASFGSVIVSGASFTKPVIDLVQKVNELYVDTYNYVKGDLSKTKKVQIKPLVQDTNHEIDQSIYAPITEKKKHSKAAAYAILAGAIAGTGLLAIAAPSLLVAAAGTIIGSAISYTAPALKFVKKVNHVYDKTEEHVKEGLDLSDEDAQPKPEQAPALKTVPGGDDQPLQISKPMAWTLAIGAAVAGVAAIVYAPAIVTAAIGGILGSASSFTTPVLKQVGKVNAFYVEACDYLKEDWQRIRGPKPGMVIQSKPADASAPSAAPKVDGQTLAPGAKEEFSKVAAPSSPAEVAPKAEFNTSAQPPVINDNKPQPDSVVQPAAQLPKKRQPGDPAP